MTPTKRTLQRCRDNGWIADVSEKWQAIPNHPGGGVRKDLFGFIDVVAITSNGILAIQATSGANTSAREAKIRGECWEAAKAWLRAGGRIEVWGWRKLKRKPEGKLWHPKIVMIES